MSKLLDSQAYETNAEADAYIDGIQLMIDLFSADVIIEKKDINDIYYVNVLEAE